MAERLILGQVLAFSGDPRTLGLDAVRHDARGGVLIRDGHIAAVGDGADLRTAHPEALVTDHGDAVILPGFIDAHAHYPRPR